MVQMQVRPLPREMMSETWEGEMGEFPDCGCHYTANDDGIHFCSKHKAVDDLLAVVREYADYVISDPDEGAYRACCGEPVDYFGREAGHKKNCPAVAAIAKAEGR